MKKLVLSIFILLVSNSVLAASPTCHSSHGGYCAYAGKVSRIYINTSNIILIYFEEPISVEDAAVAGITISHGNAAAFHVPNNPDFARMFYSTALAAQASGRNISMQMRGEQSGYLQFDRIWLADK